MNTIIMYAALLVISFGIAEFCARKFDKKINQL